MDRPRLTYSRADARWRASARPRYPQSWARVFSNGESGPLGALRLLILPILCVLATVLALNALGDGLKDALDPVIRR